MSLSRLLLFATRPRLHTSPIRSWVEPSGSTTRTRQLSFSLDKRLPKARSIRDASETSFFYELGVAHASEKPVILSSQSIDDAAGTIRLVL